MADRVLDSQGDGVLLTAALRHDERSELGGNAAADSPGASTVDRCQLGATDAALQPDRRAHAAARDGRRNVGARTRSPQH